MPLVELVELLVEVVAVPQALSSSELRLSKTIMLRVLMMTLFSLIDYYIMISPRTIGSTGPSFWVSFINYDLPTSRESRRVRAVD